MRAPTAAPRAASRGARALRPGPARAPLVRPRAEAVSQGPARDAVTEAEAEANKKRWQESGGGQGSADQWRWTLNWDPILPGILVGSCPRSGADVATIARETGATAILSLQSDLCLDALQVDLGAVKAAAREAGMVYARSAVRDFDRADQILMLPEAVRLLALLRSLDHTVYVHCTAGINRATLTVVGYLTFVQGRSLDDAVTTVTAARPQAHPYIECWRAARKRMLEGRGEEVGGVARSLFEARGAAGGVADDDDDGVGDWVAAETQLLASASARATAAARTVVDSLLELAADDAATRVAAAQAAADAARADAAAARADAASARAALEAATADGGDGRAWAAAVEGARAEAAALRAAVAEVADEAERGVAGG